MYLITVKSIYCHGLVLGLIFLKKSQCSLKEFLTLNDFLLNMLCLVIVVACLVSKKMHLSPVYGLYYDIIRLSSPIKAMNLPENINYLVHNV